MAAKIMKGKSYRWFKYQNYHLLQVELNLLRHLMDEEMPLLGEMEPDHQTLATLSVAID